MIGLDIRAFSKRNKITGILEISDEDRAELFSYTFKRGVKLLGVRPLIITPLWKNEYEIIEVFNNLRDWRRNLFVYDIHPLFTDDPILLSNIRLNTLKWNGWEEFGRYKDER